MPLLEVIAGKQTSDHAVATTAAFGRRMGKIVIVVRDTPGFWINRLLAPYLNEAARLVGEGVPIPVVDQAMRRFGFPVGPLALLDEVGLDVAGKASHVLHEGFGERMAPVDGMARLVAGGFLGRKSGRGFYEYRDGRKRGVNEAVYGLLRDGQPGHASADIEHRLVFAMLNEAALAVADGVVREARDGDIGAIYGMGFPPFRGGPLRYLDDLGAAAAVATLEQLRDVHGPRFAPAMQLVAMAEAAKRFYPS
jgi:3-hydroxyacyl-CoA dehydrogenase/enoyl-CoA hydratase/3-hydroxybutyryl-CoA epimerase